MISYQYDTSATLDEFAKEIASASGVSEGETISVLKDFRTLLRKTLLGGRSVNIAGLGYFYLSAQSKGTEKAEDFTIANISGLRICFRANSDIRLFTGTTTRSDGLKFKDLDHINDLGSVGDGSDDGGETPDPDGGSGVGFMNYYTFIIIAVFISGLMVGRTPEFLGKKVEAREMKIATIVALLHPLIILGGVALSCFLFAHYPEFVAGEGGWLNNPSFHGLSEQLYEYTSAAANNGSGFEGLGDNTYFWNYTTGWTLILGRFLPIVGQVAIAGLLAGKKYVPESAGTLKTDTVTFGVMTFAVIFIVAALSFFPAQTLGPIAEYFSIY